MEPKKKSSKKKSFEGKSDDKEAKRIIFKTSRFKMNNNVFWNNRKILPSITTIDKSLWRNKIEELRKLKFKEVFLFLSSLGKEDRKELYKLLKQTNIERIPFVHLKSDMELWELDYLVENYKTEIFNIHTQREHPLLHDYSKYKDIIYIENTISPLDEREIKDFAGICLDLSHLEGSRVMRKDVYENDIKLIKKYPIGCNHISAIDESSFLSEDANPVYDDHFISDLSELDYLKKYPKEYFSHFIVIELENSIEEQLKVKEYIINLLKDF